MRPNAPTMTAFLIPALGLLATASCLGQAVAPEGLEIRGKVVDIETGRPIGNFVVQEGRPDPDAPGGMSWDAGESWTSSSFNPSGSLKTTLNDKGNGARVVLPGTCRSRSPKKPYDGRPGKMERDRQAEARLEDRRPGARFVEETRRRGLGIPRGRPDDGAE